jgi:hypothetical protein
MANLLSHIKKLEEEYWQQDGLMDEAIESMIIYSERVQFIRVQMKRNFGVHVKTNEWGK